MKYSLKTIFVDKEARLSKTVDNWITDGFIAFSPASREYTLYGLGRSIDILCALLAGREKRELSNPMTSYLPPDYAEKELFIRTGFLIERKKGQPIMIYIGEKSCRPAGIAAEYKEIVPDRLYGNSPLSGYFWYVDSERKEIAGMIMPCRLEIESSAIKGCIQAATATACITLNK